MNTLTIGQRIKNRRLELHLTVDEVADKLGKNRATVYRYEKDDIKDLPITVLEPLAKVLETTPADLMGWSDNPCDYNISTDVEEILLQMHSFPKDTQKRLFAYWLALCQLSNTNKKKAGDYINNLLVLQNMEADLETQAAHERTDVEVTEEMRKHDDDLMDGEW